jgi:LEA14-like dessication related protein
LPAGEAFVVFGGGTINASNGAFACAQVVKASSGGLSLTNTGLTVVIRDAADNLIAQFTYGGSTGLNGGNDQSLTRSPDITGNFVQHTAATGAGPRRFSPGTKVDGTPFGSCPARLTTVTISPPAASVITNQSTQFTAQAFDQFGQPIKTASITFASDNTSVATVDSVTTDPTTGIATATVTGHTPGTAHITAQSIDGTTTVTSTQSTLTVNAAAITYSVSGQVKDAGNNPISGVLITFDMNSQGTLSSKTTLTDANGNYSSGDLGCQNTVKVTPSKAGLVFTPSATSFVNSSQCLSGSDTANFTTSAPPPGTLVISQLYVGGGNSGAAYANDYIEIFNSGTSTVDFSVTPYSIQYVGTTGSFGSTSAGNKTNITTGTIAPGQYFLVQEASGGAVGAAMPTPDATGSINMAAAGGKVALVVGTAALPAATCPGDDGTSPFNPTTSTIADFVGYGSSATTTGHCYEGSGPAAAPSNTTADFRKAGGCLDTNFNADDFLVAGANPRNTASPLNDCSAGFKPEVTINDVSVSESSANASFTVTLSTTSTLPVSVDYSTANGTATAGADYTPVSGTLTFNPGETVKNITVPIINDTMDEPNETFFVNLSNATNSTILDSQGQGTITDNDAAPTLSINDVAVAEGDTGTTNATFTVTLSAVSGLTATVNYATADGTATAGSDYQAASGTLTFNPGETTKTITVLVNGDTTFEPNETFVVNLTTPTNATILDNQGLGTITNDDAAPPTPAFSIDDVSISEGNAGTKTVNFTVSLSPTGTQTVTVDYATANGTATAGSDYQSTSGTLTFALGDATKTITVTINGDTLVEPNETFFVNLTNAGPGAIITDGQGQGTITNDDTANLVITQVYGGGNNTGATYQRDFIELFNRGATTIDFSVTPYSVQYAGSGSNFGSNKTDLTSGTIAPGHYFLIQEAGGTTNGAPLPTPDATGSINLSGTAGKVALIAGTASLPAAICPGDDGTAPFNPNDGTIADFVGYGNVVCYEGSGPAAAPSNTTADFRKAGGCLDTNDNAADFLVSAPNPRNTASPLNDCSAGFKPEVTINDVTASESAANATFTVTLSTASTLSVTVDYATADGTATAGSDYQATSGTLTFAPGETTKTINVPIINDTTDEPSETFFVNLTNATNGTILDNQGQGTITDNDNPPTLSINDVSVAEGNSGTTPADFTVTLSTASAFTVTVNYATADNTATAGSDYQSASGTLTFNPGETAKTVTVLVNGDTTFEQNETFVVNLTAPTNATISDNQGQGTITNDDAAPPTPAITIDDVSVAEGDSGTKTVNFTVSLSPTSTQIVTVDYATANGTATAPSDYQSTGGTLTFNPGETTKTITVTINGDTTVEPAETFVVNLSNVQNAIISDPQGQGTITNDDAADLVISQVYGGGGLTGATYTSDFVEIFNQGTTTVNFAVTPYSIQYAGVTSNFGAANTTTTINSGTIAPGGYFLVQEAASNTVSCGNAPCGIALPTPDATGVINLATSGGKVALISSTTPVAPDACPGDDTSTPATNPSGNNIVDFLGYGSTASCYEGTGPAPAHANTTADFRKAGGCLDTDQNASDFFVSAPVPRNTLSPTNDCSGGLKPEITINDRALTESTTPQTFTVTLSTASTLTVTVDYATANGTASAGSDYTAVSGTLTFLPGETTKTINVPIINDTLDEANETYFVNLSNASNGTILDNQGQGTINDNDNPPTLSINDASVTEGNSGTKTLDFTVTLSTASGQTVTVDYATADGTATAGTDYQAATGTLTFNPGETTKTISVTINGDTTVEPDETFTVNLTTPSNATLADGTGLGTITNDDVTPSISITDVTQNEGNSGTTNFTFTVSLSPAGTQTVTVNYATADGTATAPGDYTAISSTQLTFAPGETSKQVTVLVNGDTVVEPDENFFVNLSGATNATITDNQGTGTITNDDAVVASADLSVTKTDSPDPVAIGNDITYIITVTNGGPDTASSAVLSDTVPANTTFRSITTPAGWTCGTVPAVGGTGSISCTNPSFGVGSSVFTLVMRVGPAVADGTTISNTASVSSSTSDSNSGNNSVTQQTTVKQPVLVISQVYGGGGLTGATYKNDFIEIFNSGTTTVDFSVTPYSVQYADATNAFTTLKTDITSGTIAPGQYFLIQEFSGGATGATLPTPDATGSINLNANSGKVALVLGTTALSGTCPGDDGVAPFNPTGSGVVDFLGYGFGTTTGNPNCFEGAARATTASATANARSIMRTASCTDTNNNSADFTYTNPAGTSPPVARNKLTPPAPCSP